MRPTSIAWAKGNNIVTEMLPENRVAAVLPKRVKLHLSTHCKEASSIRTIRQLGYLIACLIHIVQVSTELDPHWVIHLAWLAVPIRPSRCFSTPHVLIFTILATLPIPRRNRVPAFAMDTICPPHLLAAMLQDIMSLQAKDWDRVHEAHA